MKDKPECKCKATEEQIARIVRTPVFFERNRVFRNYIGGAGFGPLMNDNTGDNSFPEEWIASKVKAINPVYFGERDGVSVVEGTDIFSTTCSPLIPKSCSAA